MKRNDRGRSDPSAALEQPRDEDFLERWSRRKAQAREQSLPPESDTEANAQPLVPEAAPEAPPLTDADMPPIDSLTAESDISGFLSPGVSEKLRRMALRKVFSLPLYNVRDGLDDYDDDFTVFEPLGDTVTADMRHRREREAEMQREREALERQQVEAEETEIISDEDEDRQTARRATDEAGATPQPESDATPDGQLDADENGRDA